MAHPRQPAWRSFTAATTDSECTYDQYNYDANYVLPDTPIYLGSVTKYLTAAVARHTSRHR